MIESNLVCTVQSFVKHGLQLLDSSYLVSGISAILVSIKPVGFSPLSHTQKKFLENSIDEEVVNYTR